MTFDVTGPEATTPSEVPEVPDISTPELFLGFSAMYERSRRSGKITYEAAVAARSAVQFLVEKGIVTREEVDERFAIVGDDIGEAYGMAGLSVMLAAPDDKYDVDPAELPDIDCAARVSVCKAACCSMRWALTEQDVLEGVVQWDLMHPYANRLGSDGWCAHCAPETKACGVYEQRPKVCRTYDCREDPRIWADFENWEINPDLFDEEGRVRHPGNRDMAPEET